MNAVAFTAGEWVSRLQMRPGRPRSREPEQVPGSTWRRVPAGFRVLLVLPFSVGVPALAGWSLDSNAKMYRHGSSGIRAFPFAST